MTLSNVENKTPGAYAPLVWPDGKEFAFTIFDDTDRATLANVSPVYDMLADLGFRTTKSVWPVAGPQEPVIPGDTCEDPGYLEWLQRINSQGFEIGYHLATYHTSDREESLAGLQAFERMFGHRPKSFANHFDNSEAIYWGEARLTGINRLFYKLANRGRGGAFFGHKEGDRRFWGDYCREYVTYVRNFVFRDINTLKACPQMPYHDPARPYANFWFASSDGGELADFNRCLDESNQDRLAGERGASIVYTHFGKGFFSEGKLDPRFHDLMKRLSSMNGWFVPVNELLDYLKSQGRGGNISAHERGRLERAWLVEKFRSRLTT